MEVRYTAAEIRMLELRRQCAKEGHRPERELMAAAPAGYFPTREEPLVLDGGTFECRRCDALVTITFPVIGKEVED